MQWTLVASVGRADGALLLSRGRRGSTSRARERRPGGAVPAAGAPLARGSSLDAFVDARGGIMPELQLDAAGRRRSPTTLPHFHAGRPPRNKGIRYPADPPTVEEIVAVMRAAGDGVHGRRLRGLIVVLWRAACASTRRSRSPRPTWTHAADHCSCGAARARRVASSSVNARNLLLALFIRHGARACTRRSPSPSAASGRDPSRPGPVRRRSRCGTSPGGGARTGRTGPGSR